MNNNKMSISSGFSLIRHALHESKQLLSLTDNVQSTQIQRQIITATLETLNALTGAINAVQELVNVQQNEINALRERVENLKIIDNV